MNQAEPRQGQQGIDLFDALGTASEELGQPSGRDDAGLVADLFRDAVDQSVDEREIAEVEAGLDGTDGRLADDPVGPPDLDPPQPSGALEERLRGDRDARHDDSARVLPLLGDDVERGRRSEVDDDAGAAQPLVGGDRVDDAVRADFLRGVVEDRHPGADSRLHEERLATGDLAKGLAQGELERRDDARDDHVAGGVGRAAPRVEQPLRRQRDLVGSRVPARRQPPVADELLALEEAEHRIRVSDVHGEEPAEPAAAALAPHHSSSSPLATTVSPSAVSSRRNPERSSPRYRPVTTSPLRRTRRVSPGRCAETLSHSPTSRDQSACASPASIRSTTACTSGAISTGRPISSSIVVAAGTPTSAAAPRAFTPTPTAR